MKKLQYGDKCKQGHVLTPDTVQIIQNRGLRCKICQREAVEKYQAKNKEKILQRLKRKWLLDDTLKVQNRKRKREEYKRNPEKLKERRKMWRLNNLDKVREWHSAPERKIHSNISRAIRQAMKQRKNGRQWETIVGYTLDDLLIRLESQFKEGMGFHNYGEWEIDHIKPRSSFDFSNDSSVAECWKLDNLQPLWMSENRRKWANV